MVASYWKGRTGPPIAPRMTASDFLAASRASSVRGDPVASIEAWERNQHLDLPLDVSWACVRRREGVLGN